MTLPSFTDLGLAAVVLTIAVIPAALTVLAAAGILESAQWRTRLEARLGTPGFRVAAALGTLAVVALFLRLSWDWSAATHLKPQCAALAEPWFAAEGPTGPGGVSLRVGRRTVESGYWTTITADRYQALDDATGALVAEGHEVWIDTGHTRYRCGLASGPVPLRGFAEPDPAGIRRFLFRAGAPR